MRKSFSNVILECKIENFRIFTIFFVLLHFFRFPQRYEFFVPLKRQDGNRIIRIALPIDRRFQAVLGTYFSLPSSSRNLFLVRNRFPTFSHEISLKKHEKTWKNDYFKSFLIENSWCKFKPWTFFSQPGFFSWNFEKMKIWKNPTSSKTPKIEALYVPVSRALLKI